MTSHRLNHIDYRSMPLGRLEEAVLTLTTLKDQGRVFSGEQAIAYSKACNELSRRDALASQYFHMNEYEARHS